MSNCIIRDTTQQQGNVHLVVHPFAFGRIMMMMNKGDYVNHDGTEMLEWQKRLSDNLWDAIPGIRDMFFSNGEITIQHNEIFCDAEVVTTASEIIRRYICGGNHSVMGEFNKVIISHPTFPTYRGA